MASQRRVSLLSGVSQTFTVAFHPHFDESVLESFLWDHPPVADCTELGCYP